MSLTISTIEYTVDAPSANAVVYRHPAATLTHKAQLKLGRTDAKPTAVNPGVTRSEGKVTRYVDAGERIDPIIMRAETSVPVMSTTADVDAVIAEFRAFVASAAFADLVKGGKIYYA